jgi:penicillin-binding protein 2
MRFAVRLSVVGLVFVTMFSVVGLRLWFIQVAQGPAIAEASTEQAWIQRTVQAPRGDIYDRNGALLVTSRIVPAVIVDRTFIQNSEQGEHVVTRLAALLSMPRSELAGMYEKAGINGRFEVGTVSPEVAYRINESLDELPGVQIVKVPERVYINGPTAAHVIGHLGLPDASDLEERPELDPSVRVGKLGIERFYDELLQGVPGQEEYRVRRGQIIDTRPAVAPVQGSSVVLSIDLATQEVVEMALEQGIQLSNEVKDQDRANGREVFSETQRGAVVVLDVNTFEVVAAASYPDFDPQLFVAGIDADTFQALNDARAFNNLATNGLYPPASTFKAIMYAVDMEERLPFPEGIEGIDPDNRQVHCDGTLELPQLADGTEQVKRDWYVGSNYGWRDLSGALEISCNIYFWSLGLGTYQSYRPGDPKETVIQDWAKLLGYGSKTGIDLANEASGVVPTRELFEEWKQYQLENPDQPPRLDRSRLDLASPWLGGDLMDFSIGQGAFTATPLQVAVSYAALVNGGKVYEPRIAREIIRPDGTREPVGTVLRREVPIDEGSRRSLLRDLNRVVTSGTARGAFANFGPGLDRVGGKTGTGQSVKTRDNHAWFVGVAPIDDPKYVVVVLIDEGGSGGGVAAPVARHILQHLMGNEPTPIVQGDRAD